jgi:hypothetical protein
MATTVDILPAGNTALFRFDPAQGGWIEPITDLAWGLATFTVAGGAIWTEMAVIDSALDEGILEITFRFNGVVLRPQVVTASLIAARFSDAAMNETPVVSALAATNSSTRLANRGRGGLVRGRSR